MDFRDFNRGQDKTFANGIDRKWWMLKGDEAADSISATLAALEKHQSVRVAQQVTSSRMYGNLSPMGGMGASSSRLAAVSSGMKDRISYNLVQSVVDTAASKMIKNKPKPLFLTSGGDYRVQRKAKKLNQFVDGIFYENKAYELGFLAFRDGCVWGDGCIGVSEKNGRVCYERVMSSELYVDEIEALSGVPRQMHRVKLVDRSVLTSFFPAHKTAIELTNSARVDSGERSNVADVVVVRESWHLPSGPDAKDGKHLLTLDGHALGAMDEWAHDFFPFAKFSWSPRLYGYWGQGLAEQLQNIQVEINKLLWIIQRSFHLGGSFKVFMESGSKVVKEHLNNDVGSIVTYTGTKPEYVVPPLVPSEIYMHLKELIQRGYEQAGISMLNATSQKPSGLNSGKALREFDDINTDRFQSVGQAYQDFFLQLAKLSISTAKDIAESNRGHYKVKVPGRKFLESVDWSDIDLEDDDYVMQCFPVSSLPNDPAGRLQTVQEYAQAGYLTPRQAKRLLDFPDLDQIESLANASEDYLASVFDKIIDDGEYTPPEPFDDLQLAREMALEYYARGKIQDLDDDRLQLLRNFISQIDMMQDLMAANQPQMPGSAPQAAPMPAPQSDLIPNVPQAA